MADQAVRLRSLRVETSYQSAVELQPYEEIAFAGGSVTHNAQRPHPKAKEPECLIRPNRYLINGCGTVFRRRGEGKKHLSQIWRCFLCSSQSSDLADCHIEGFNQIPG